MSEWRVCVSPARNSSHNFQRADCLMECVGLSRRLWPRVRRSDRLSTLVEKSATCSSASDSQAVLSTEAPAAATLTD